MKLQKLQVEQLRQFQQPLVLDNLQPGLNLIHGPNESGKSTLVRAIRAAFFERYRSKSVDDLSPWGDSGASPTIRLEFEHQGTPWRLTKSFLKRARCDLSIGTETYSGDQAEERVAELLGYEYSKKGSSKAEHWGIPGLLWVEQGTGQEVQKAIEHAGDHLQSALNALVGEVASSGGDAVIETLSAERNKLLTRTGQPTGDFKQLVEQRQELQQRKADLQERVSRYQDYVDRLQSVTREYQHDQQTRPWEAAQQQLTEARARLDKLEQLEQQQQQETQTLSHIDQQRKLTEQRLDDLRRIDQQKADRQAGLEKAEQSLRDAKARGPALAEQLRIARDDYETSQSRLKTARLLAERQRIGKEIERLTQRKALLAGNRDKARKHQGQVAEARQQARDNRIDAGAVQDLKKTEQALGHERIRSQAIATRLSWKLAPESGARLGDSGLSEQGEQQLLEASRLTIPGVGHFDITPGGEQLAETRRKLESLEQACADQLAQLAVTSVEEAEQRKLAYEKADQQRRHAEELLHSVAPAGVEALDAELSEVELELKNHHQRLQANPLPADADDGLSLSEAEAVNDRAESHLKTCEHQQRELEALTMSRQQARDNAFAEWQRLDQETGSQAHQQQLADLKQRLEALTGERDQARTNLEQRAREIQQAHPDILRQDIERYQITIDNLRNRQQGRDREIREIRARLDAWGAEGLEETLQEVAADCERCERRYRELSRRADALERLVSLLNEKRQALTRRLQAPLQRHLDHYVSLLFPQARLALDDQLQPDTFTRGSELGPVKDLSFGAREQMGLISRLAYADLLKEADRPTLVILDDTLVHSDQSRLDDMKRILFDAARRHQVLLFTCHPEKWQDLGVLPTDLEQLKSAPAPAS
ncbi:AAA family ATPase [Marinobacter bryozoorum]|uniref:AAA family ATPase n=1 Tax=Marinobacter bryozoorum TaxID=256324 RepID=UPI0020051C05|nr:AAA family ATPase [Marinobacter bryozoorum]MCK7544491.1 AAA family ATPase [Marinobacter bryozoorum]